MDRALLTPRWIITHVLMVVAVIVMVLLGFWQLDRLDQRRTRNTEIETRTELPVLPVGDLASADDPFDVGVELRFRIASAQGTYVVDDEILVRNRSLNGSPGFWVLTPLMLDEGSAVVVNRGWVPFRMGPGSSRAGTEAPSGVVRVEGLVRETVEAGGIEVSDGAGPLETLGRVDLERYADELGYPILPVYLQLEAQDPATAELPATISRPELGEGAHLSYAGQWFIFAAIAAVGYPLALKRLLRRRADGTRHSDVPVDYL